MFLSLSVCLRLSLSVEGICTYGKFIVVVYRFVTVAFTSLLVCPRLVSMLTFESIYIYIYYSRIV
jgi:hypothetical protein